MLYGGAGGNPAYGGIPAVPNPTSTASSAIAGNLANANSIYNLAQQTGAGAGAGVISALNQEIPGISGTIGSATGNINQLLSGQVPDDVITQLRQQSAEIGAGSGMGPMAPFTNAQYLRSLGLTSLGMKQQGLSALNALMGSVPRAPAFDPSSMLVTPAQQQEAQWMAEMMRRAPNPTAAAAANLAALRAGMGVGGGSPVGGFNLPVRGGPAFEEPPLPSGGYGPDVTYGATGVGDPYLTPNDAAYTNWQKMFGGGAPEFTGAGDTAAETMWNTLQGGGTMEDVYNLGLSPAIEPTMIQDMPAAGPMDVYSGGGYGSGYDPYSAGDYYGE
jgi:hypothetical protein